MPERISRRVDGQVGAAHLDELLGEEFGAVERACLYGVLRQGGRRVNSRQTAVCGGRAGVGWAGGEGEGGGG